MANKGKKKQTKNGKMKRKAYERELAELEVELVKLQGWIKNKGLKVAVIFEGRDSAGKGGTIKRITRRLSPRVVRVAALPAPTEKEKTQWYFQRYVPHLPSAGEMVLFDRSWYNRAGVERVMGFCTNDEYAEFMSTVNGFELALTRSGLTLIKYWLDITDETQEARFQQRISYGPGGALPVGGLLQSAGCDVDAHQHRPRALVHRGCQYQTPRPSERHRPLA
jgi:polyphosphate kinase 2